MTATDALSQQDRNQVEQWAVQFNSARPSDGRLTAAVIEGAGPIPVAGAAARAAAREYFVSKLPAAEVRRTHALQAGNPASVPEDWFNAPAYWRAVIAWLDEQQTRTDDAAASSAATPATQRPRPRPQWYFRDDLVELDRDVAINGTPYRQGARATVLAVEDDTLLKLAREGRVAVMFSGDDLKVVPVELLRPARTGPALGPLRSPDGCEHEWTAGGYRWGPVDRERGLRPFWTREVCSACGEERLDDPDEYYGADLGFVHLKWRGSTW